MGLGEPQTLGWASLNPGQASLSPMVGQASTYCCTRLPWLRLRFALEQKMAPLLKESVLIAKLPN